MLALDDREHCDGCPDARKAIDHIEDGTETDLRVGTRAEDISRITQERTQEEHGRDRRQKGHEVQETRNEGGPPRRIERLPLGVGGVPGLVQSVLPLDCGRAAGQRARASRGSWTRMAAASVRPPRRDRPVPTAIAARVRDALTDELYDLDDSEDDQGDAENPDADFGPSQAAIQEFECRRLAHL